MATHTYSYLAPDGTVKTVDVTDTQGSCQLVSTRRGTRGAGTRDVEPYRKVITISLSVAIAVPLDIYFDVDTDVLRPGNTAFEDEETKLTKFTINRAVEEQEITVICRRDYTNNEEAITRTYNHTFLAQPVAPEPDEVYEPVIPSETPFGDAPIFFLEGLQTTPNKIYGKLESDIRIDIFKRGGAVNTKEIAVYQRNPLKIRWDNADEENIFKPIRASAASLNLFGFVEDEFKQLFEEVDGNLRIDYRIGGILFWQGYNVSDQYEEQYYKPPFSITANFSDGLALLKREPFVTTSTRIPIHDVIKEILKKISSKLDVLDAIYTYPVEAEMNIKRSPWEKTEVDCRVYQDEKGPNSCYEVFEKILKPFGATLRLGHAGGKARWIFEEPLAALYNLSYREYNYNLAYQGVRGRPATIKIDNPDVNFAPFQINAERSSKKQRSIINRVEINKKLEFIPDLVPGGEFFTNDFSYTQSRDETDVLKNWEKTGDFLIKRVSLGGQKVNTNRGGIGVINANYGLSVPALHPTTLISVDSNDNLQDPAIATHFDFDTYLKSDAVSVKTEAGNYFDLEVSYRFKIDNTALESYVNSYVGEIYHMQLPVRIKVGGKYLNESRSWVDNPVTLLLPATRYNQFFYFEQRDLIIPEDGNFELFIYQPSKPVTADPAESVNLLQDTTARVEIDYIRGIYKPSGDFASNEETVVGEVEVGRGVNTNSYSLEVVHADVNTLQNLSSLTYDGVLTTQWGTYYGNQAQTTELARLLIQKILNVYISNNKWILREFEILPFGATSLSPAHTFTIGKFSEERVVYGRRRGSYRRTLPGEKFYCTSATFDSYQAKWEFVWVQLANSDVVVQYSYIDKKISSSSSGGVVPSGNLGGRESVNTSNPFDIAKVSRPVASLDDFVSVYYDRSRGKLGVKYGDFDPGSIGGSALSEVRYEDDSLVFVTPNSTDVLFDLTNTLDQRYGFDDYVPVSGGTFEGPLGVKGLLNIFPETGNPKISNTVNSNYARVELRDDNSTIKVRLDSDDNESYFATLAVGKTGNDQYPFEVQGVSYATQLRAENYYYDAGQNEDKMAVFGSNKLLKLVDIPQPGNDITVASTTNLGGIKVNGYGLQMVTEFLRLNISSGLEFVGGSGALKTKIGTGLEYSAGAMVVDTDTIASRSWVSSNFNNYSLPTASETTKGGAKIGGPKLYMVNDTLYGRNLQSNKTEISTQSQVQLNTTSFIDVYNQNLNISNSGGLYASIKITNNLTAPGEVLDFELLLDNEVVCSISPYVVRAGQNFTLSGVIPRNAGLANIKVRAKAQTVNANRYVQVNLGDLIELF